MAINAPSIKINAQSGNILIYILGAIVLIGLLTIMVKGSSTPGGGIDREALEIRVAEVQAYGNELERAVAYVLRSGYSETDIRFAHPNHNSAYGNITNDPARQIFAREGGGATWRDNESDIQMVDTDWVFNGTGAIRQIGTPAGACPKHDTTCSELIAYLPNVTKSFCLLINDKNGITNPAGEPAPDDSTVDILTPFTGTYERDSLILGAGLYHDGTTEGCFEGDVNPPVGTYHYYRVLLPR